MTETILQGLGPITGIVSHYASNSVRLKSLHEHSYPLKRKFQTAINHTHGYFLQEVFFLLRHYPIIPLLHDNSKIGALGEHSLLANNSGLSHSEVK